MKYSDEVPFLVAQSGPLNGHRWALRGQFILGREPNCDIVISDRQVSRHHACVRIVPEGVLLEDMGSKNGIHYNGNLLTEPVYLQDGDVIQIAFAQSFIFLSSDSTIPLENQPLDHIDLQLQPNTVPGSLSQEGRLLLEKRSRRVWITIAAEEGRIERKEIVPPLSASQFRLLEALFENQGRVITRPSLVASVWGEGQAFEISEQALDALVRRLRDRIAGIDPSHEYIVTVRGHGLRLDNPPI